MLAFAAFGAPAFFGGGVAAAELACSLGTGFVFNGVAGCGDL
jgi:hypothetical protein